MKIRITNDNKIWFWCPACDAGHVINIDQSKNPKWSWNQDREKPTITPSLDVKGPVNDLRFIERCHSIVTDGKIFYCGDSTHELAGKTVDLPDND